MEELLPFNEPEYIANPYAYWERLRDEAPVYWSETNGFWALVHESPARGRPVSRASRRMGWMGHDLA